MPPAPAYFPYGIYAVPEISTVGMSEEEVKEKKIPYECGIARFRETSRGHIMGLDTGLMKMIFSIKTRRLLGVHIIGEGATELIHIGQAVLNLKGGIDYSSRTPSITPRSPKPTRLPRSTPGTGCRARTERRCLYLLVAVASLRPAKTALCAIVVHFSSMLCRDSGHWREYRMLIEITPALNDALKTCSEIERNLIAIGQRSDPQRKADLVQWRRKFAEQMGQVGQLIEQDAALRQRPEMAREMHSLLSSFRFAIGQHQASWPAVRIDEDAEAYAASARGTYARSDLFWSWCSRHLAFTRH